MDQTTQITFLSGLIPLIGILLIISCGVILLNYQFRKNVHRQVLEREDLKSRHKSELLRWSIQVQEDERRRISSDMHDELGALLSISIMLCKQMSATKVYDETHLKNLEELISSSLTSTRRICYELLPPHLERYGLLSAIQSLQDKINTTETICFSCVCAPNFPRLPRETEVGVYRILSELTSNTLKHSLAKTIKVDLTLESGFLQCVYSDDGQGLPQGLLTRGLGLKSIETRTASLGGSFTLIPHSSGFNANILIPR